MLSINRNDSAEYAERYAHLKVTGTQYLAFRDIPELVSKHVSTGIVTLDYGCGVGKSSAFLKSLGLRVKGVDINKQMIGYTKNVNPNIEYEVIQSGKIPSPDQSYDFVFSSWVLMEIASKEELRRILKEIARVLKPFGTFMTVVTNEESYNTDWLSENTEFEENKNLRSGGIVKMWFKEINLSLYDYFWSDQDYRDVIKEAGLTLMEIHKPIGRDDDGYAWKNEKLKSPCSIYVAKKLF